MQFNEYIGKRIRNEYGMVRFFHRCQGLRDVLHLLETSATHTHALGKTLPDETLSSDTSVDDCQANTTYSSSKTAFSYMHSSHIFSSSIMSQNFDFLASPSNAK